MPCNCRGSGTGVVIVGDNGVDVTGAGTAARPYRVSTSLADSLVFEVRDSTTVNLTITGSGSLEDPYVLRADTGSVTSLTSLADVRSDAPTAGAVPTWVAADSSTGIAGHWEFQVPDLGGEAATSVPASILTGTIADARLPARLGTTAALIATGTNLNTVLTSGWYRGDSLPNSPGASWFYYEVISHDSTGFVVQLAYSYFEPYTSYVRRLNNGTWSAWSRVITKIDIDAGYLDDRYPKRDLDAVISQRMLPFADASGSTNVGVTTASGGGYAGTQTLVWPAGRFTGTPQVQLTAEDNTAGAMKAGVVPGSVTATGCQIYVWRTASSASLKVYYYARDSRLS